jgi:hypothetical protein
MFSLSLLAQRGVSKSSWPLMNQKLRHKQGKMKKTGTLAVVTLILIILFATESFSQAAKGMK